VAEKKKKIVQGEPWEKIAQVLFTIQVLFERKEIAQAFVHHK